MEYKIATNKGSKVDKLAGKTNKRDVIRLLNKSYMFIGDGRTILEWTRGEEDKFLLNLQVVIDKLKEVKKQNETKS